MTSARRCISSSSSIRRPFAAHPSTWNLTVVGSTPGGGCHSKLSTIWYREAIARV